MKPGKVWGAVRTCSDRIPRIIVTLCALEGDVFDYLGVSVFELLT